MWFSTGNHFVFQFREQKAMFEVEGKERMEEIWRGRRRGLSVLWGMGLEGHPLRLQERGPGCV